MRVKRKQESPFVGPVLLSRRKPYGTTSNRGLLEVSSLTIQCFLHNLTPFIKKPRFFHPDRKCLAPKA